MELAVFVTPHPPGFRARTGSPLDLTADGLTVDDALDDLRSQVASKLVDGSKVRTLTLTDVDSIQAAAGKVGESPLFEDWVAAVEEYRKEHNAVSEPG